MITTINGVNNKKNTAIQLILNQTVEKAIKFCEGQHQLILKFTQDFINFIVEENKKACQARKEIRQSEKLSLEEKVLQTKKIGEKFKTAVKTATNRHKQTARLMSELFKSQANFFVEMIQLSSELLRSAQETPSIIEIETVIGKKIAEFHGPSCRLVLEEMYEISKDFIELATQLTHGEQQAIAQDKSQFEKEISLAQYKEVHDAHVITMEAANNNCEEASNIAQHLIDTQSKFFIKFIKKTKEIFMPLTENPGYLQQTSSRFNFFKHPQDSELQNKLHAQLEPLNWPEGFSFRVGSKNDYIISLAGDLKNSPHFEDFQHAIKSMADDLEIKEINGSIKQVVLYDPSDVAKLREKLQAIASVVYTQTNPSC